MVSGLHEVLSTDRNNDHAIKPVTTCDTLDAICNEISALKREAHAKGPHRDTIANSRHAELVACESGLCDRFFDTLS